MLRDGTRVVIRAIRPRDHDAESRFVEKLSAESRYFRFFNTKPRLDDQEIRYFTEVDFVSHVALVATQFDNSSKSIVGVARYVQSNDSSRHSAEVAFAVDDTYHGLGLATILLHHLAAIAMANGVVEFRASVLAQNHAMIDVFANSGFARHAITKQGVTDVVIFLDKRDDSSDRVGRRG